MRILSGDNESNLRLENKYFALSDGYSLWNAVREGMEVERNSFNNLMSLSRSCLLHNSSLEMDWARVVSWPSSVCKSALVMVGIHNVSQMRSI